MNIEQFRELDIPEEIKNDIKFCTSKQSVPGAMELVKIENKLTYTMITNCESPPNIANIINSVTEQIITEWFAKAIGRTYRRYNYLRPMNEKIYLVVCKDFKDACTKIFESFKTFILRIDRGDKFDGDADFLDSLGTNILLWHLEGDLLFSRPNELAALYKQVFELKKNFPRYKIFKKRGKVVKIEFNNVDMPIIFIHNYVCYILRVKMIRSQMIDDCSQSDSTIDLHFEINLLRLTKNKINQAMSLKLIDDHNYPHDILMDIKEAFGDNSSSSFFENFEGPKAHQK